MPESTERIGLLLVHGVGEQRRFEHLVSEVRHIVSALEADCNVERVSVQVNSSRTAAYLAEQETWTADDGAPVVVTVKKKESGATIKLHVHEVWYADLDEPVTLSSRRRFWRWGLSLWMVKPFTKSQTAGAKEMWQPKFPKRNQGRGLLVRLQLFCIGVIFSLLAVSLLAVSLSLVNGILRLFQLGPIPGGKTLVRYVGDVKLIQQRRRYEDGPLSDMNLPPRVSIRRRVVRTMIDMSRQKYSRWYIAAHSLGTVVAWNGLMESEHCLPNYLDEEYWNLLQQCPNLVKSICSLPSTNTNLMQPTRPPWLNEGDAINRKVLFKNLRGFLTYGSPLDKFAHLWPAIVPFNKNEIVGGGTSAFTEKFEWINVYDETDAIGGELNAYGGELNAYGGELNAYGGKLKAIGGELNAYGGELNAYGGKLNAYGGELNAYGGKLKAIGGELKAIGGELKAIGEKLNAYDGELKAIGEELNAYGEELKDYGGELKDYGGELKDYGGKLKDYGGKLKAIGEKLKDYGGKLKDSEKAVCQHPKAQNQNGPIPTAISLTNYSFRSSRILLLSHTKYLHFKPGKKGRLVNRLAKWLLNGREFPKPEPPDPEWVFGASIYWRKILRVVQWGVAVLLLAVLLAVIVSFVLTPILKWGVIKACGAVGCWEAAWIKTSCQFWSTVTYYTAWVLAWVLAWLPAWVLAPLSALFGALARLPAWVLAPLSALFGASIIVGLVGLRGRLRENREDKPAK